MSADAGASPLIEVARRLSRELGELRFGPPVAYVYNPLVYAWQAHARYLERWGAGEKEVLLLGMNPGPFGMAQTGVPFGDVMIVRSFLGIEAPIGKPPREHAKRPVLGFSCPRSEVSGSRLWGWARARFNAPERFFERFFVANYCPLAFLEASGRNLTPDKLPAGMRQPLFDRCDEALRDTTRLTGARSVIGVGCFARDAAIRALAGTPVKIGCMLHPSPASPKANRGWAAAAERDLAECGVVV